MLNYWGKLFIEIDKEIDKIVEATTTGDVAGTPEPTKVDWHKKKKNKIIRRTLNTVQKI